MQQKKTPTFKNATGMLKATFELFETTPTIDKVGVCCLSCVVVLFEGFVSWHKLSAACLPPNNTKRAEEIHAATGVLRATLAEWGCAPVLWWNWLTD